jgi:hypothetical protein
MPVGKKIIHQQGLFREDRYENLRRPRGVAVPLFPIVQRAFGHPNALGELKLGRPGFRSECGHIHWRDFNSRPPAAAVARADPSRTLIFFVLRPAKFGAQVRQWRKPLLWAGDYQDRLKNRTEHYSGETFFGQKSRI